MRCPAVNVTIRSPGNSVAPVVAVKIVKEEILLLDSNFCHSTSLRISMPRASTMGAATGTAACLPACLAACEIGFSFSLLH